jgi:F-type H+-transporting ATPase subunit delta
MRRGKRVKREAKQFFRLCVVKDHLDESRLHEVVQQIASGKLRTRPAILEELLHLTKLDQARHAARIESAVPMSPDLQSAIRATLVRRFASELTTDFAVNPALIGGVRIQVGSNVYDGSIRAGLAAFEKGF